ncbi:hypothetical protein TrVE_jg5960 [Triparma verrucosa]|uniref:Ubiquitin fusion degradation protein UFD1 N-terminal subdomain 2 domain-containing protein n=1 Tax=Triparma verrucosa TaxID=1606542 RepID=A0A9W7BQ57_9STRA|nr:hypothetical protein TrVE_jg5960 [Triparma verrucosa]
MIHRQHSALIHRLIRRVQRSAVLLGPLILLLSLSILPSLVTCVSSSSSNSDLSSLSTRVSNSNIPLVLSPANEANIVNPLNLIALPLPHHFNPPLGSFSRDHLEDGDKISLPSSYWSHISDGRGGIRYEVPWVIRVSRLDDPSQGITTTGGVKTRVLQPKKNVTYKSYLPSSPSSVLCSPLDFRSPSNYVFLPPWCFRALGLRPGEVVRCHLETTIPKGGRIKLRPLTFKNEIESEDGCRVGTAKEFMSIDNHQAVLETELKHYSTLTSGSVVSFKFGDARYFFKVEETREGKKGERKVKDGVKVMDCDVIVEFLKEKIVK